jgi:hypothetical protein
LYIIRTNRVPPFLDPTSIDLNIDTAQWYAAKERFGVGEFLDNLAEKYDRLQVPILAIMDRSRAVLMHYMNIQIRLPEDPRRIAELIDRLKKRKNLADMVESCRARSVVLNMPITAVIDCTQDIPTIREAYQLLRDMYNYRIREPTFNFSG